MSDWMDGNKGLGGIAKQIERQKEVKALAEKKPSLPPLWLDESSGKAVDVSPVKLGCAPGLAVNPFRASSCRLAGPVGSGIPNAYPID